MLVMRHCVGLTVVLSISLWTGTPYCLGQSKADPKDWILWRSGPISFPSMMCPLVPETLEGGPAVDLGPSGADLSIVLPDQAQDDYDGAALTTMARQIQHKAPKAALVTAAEISTAGRAKNLILLGTLARNSLARSILPPDLAFMRGITAAGYHIKPVANPYSPGKTAILSIGVDAPGAWAAATILAHAIHPQQERLGPLRRWPIKLPEGACWAPFEAAYTLDKDSIVLPALPNPPPTPPRIPFGVRCWGSPMPTLEGYQRMIRALKPLGVNTIAVQSGGWVDLPNAPQIFRTALEIAYREGIFTVLYVGNEERGHRPAPLSKNHRDVVLAVKDHPGLLEWHLYNQLASDMPAADYQLVRAQVEWLRSVSGKRVGMEVVWGHGQSEIPESKARLIRDLKSWGVAVIAHDYAPIGGWTKQHDLSRWEPRLRALEPLGVTTEAVLQGHVPFLEPTLPTPAELRNQFWWCVAAGTQGYLVECAYLFNDFSLRGLLSWTLEPLSDGRCAELPRLAGILRRIEPMLLRSRPSTDEEIAHAGIRLATPQPSVALRMRSTPGGIVYLLLINKSLDAATGFELTLDGNRVSYEAAELARGDHSRPFSSGQRLHVTLPAGGGACYRLIPH